MLRSLSSTNGRLLVQREAGPLIAGIDEVGVGACAGPVVVAGTVAQVGWADKRVKDSKAFSDTNKTTAHQKRLAVLNEVVLPGVLFTVQYWAGSRDVDAVGIDVAVQRLTFMVYEACRKFAPDALMVLDGNGDNIPYKSSYEHTICFPKADKYVAVVSAASIVAKTARDKYMLLLEGPHPGYGFGKHKGYPTEQHTKALKDLGLCEEHRRSYKPVARAARG